ncbi:2-hydroxyglutaryl-CoA dehydratase, D-component [Syntrophomonas zehnderi OL-4]|uniref:2-hydroxyglutaryl-CoA dehydratase, D-component n=1 Tax=Syntrophomonas zehnderi OL-4 TaxID=690567 RepID=A0A0E4GAB1_9FIRM|nr:2-hydroxyacyl-CoA dehydratase family protein [Syntrophomonas zehnderi]CFX42521.1 2-hydroxyglutaryl-CoA dehydratase, D-component [Syntrophomonas zehnderi OL-4]
MEDILTKFKDYCERPYERAAQLKATRNIKIIGCLPMYFPEEIIHAAGALPVTLFGSDEPITLGDGHMMTNACDQVRSSFDSLLKGKYDFLDGIAAIYVCDQVRFYLEVWQLDYPVEFFHQMWRPYKLDKSTQVFFRSELERLISSLEEFTGNKITDEKLRASIKVYNDSRAMMRKLNDLRKARPGIVSASDMARIVAASMFIPREEHNELLGQLLAQIEQSDAAASQSLRVITIGHPCSMPETEVLDLIEANGMVVVDDDFFTGGRYFSKDVSASGDPIDAFIDFYMNAIPCTTYHFPENWLETGKSFSPYADYVIDLMRQGQAKGIVVLKEMYCDPYDMEFVLMKKRFEEEAIPYVSIITEHGSGPLEAIRTRVQAFEESLRFI